ACNRESRRLGDIAAGTLVVHTERKAKPIQALPEAAGKTSAVRQPLICQRLAQLEREQKQTLLDLSLRRNQLSVRDRSRLFRAAAEFLQERLDLAPEEYVSDEKFVLQLTAMLGERPAPEAETALAKSEK